MREAGVVAIGIEVVANAEVHQQVRIRPPGIFNECPVEVRVRVDVRRADAVCVRKRQGCRVGEIDEEPVLIRVDAQTFMDVLPGEAGFQIVRRAADGQTVVQRVAQLVGVAVAEAGRPGCSFPSAAYCRRRTTPPGRNGYWSVRKSAGVRTADAPHSSGVGNGRVVLEGTVPILALQRLAVGLIGHAADAEVVLL